MTLQRMRLARDDDHPIRVGATRDPEWVTLTVHHQSLTIGSVVSELYYSPANRILEVDIPGQAFAIVHENFQLQAPPPPPADASPTGQQQQNPGDPPTQPQ